MINQNRKFYMILKFMLEEKSKNKFFLSAFAGAVCNLAFAPFHWFFPILISIPIFYFLISVAKNRKETFWFGWFYGFGYFVAGIYWISISLLVDAKQFAWLIPFAATLIPAVLAIYFALFALSYKFLVDRFFVKQVYEKVLLFSSLWILFEILRSFLFTGFPWNLIGYIWCFNDNFLQISAIFGIWGLSLIAVLVGLIPVLFISYKNGEFVFNNHLYDKIFGTIIIFILASSFFYGLYRIDSSKLVVDSSKKLRLVQGNIKQSAKWNLEEKYRNFFKHIRLTNSKDLREVKAVIWSETAVPYAIDNNSELLNKLKLAVPEEGILITGALRLGYSSLGEVDEVWNSVFNIGDSGVLDYYDKHHLVPFGEYVPLQKYLPFISKITDGAMGFSEGEGVKTLKNNVFSFSPLLCYEVIFSDKIIDKNNRPDLLVNLTNDAWFGRSSGPYQHLDMAKVRSVEYGISLARVANTGITAFFNPLGQLVDKIELNDEGVIDVDFVNNIEPTVYSKFGFYPLFILLSFFGLFIVRNKLK
ncbi:MAG: apolipoprotein N-acyltransferase [Pelagibacterales bacterium]|nr:apolipoprotein N-acyltransferase [Pelagibacterales bacterium]